MNFREISGGNEVRNNRLGFWGDPDPEVELITIINEEIHY